MSVPVYVLDASVGVKWFRDEPGSEAAHAVIAEHIAGSAVIAVDSLFLYEVLRAAPRDHRAEDVARVWQDLTRLDLVVVPLGEELVGAAVAARVALDCSLYDAFAAGLANLLGAPLFSADARAHGNHPDVRLMVE